jgi:Mg-chelatase subunit ChlI
VDEVNLLDDGLVDVVLDSAASGINTVEREGISIVHPAKFIMVGSGNPAVSQNHWLRMVEIMAMSHSHTVTYCLI